MSQLRAGACLSLSGRFGQFGRQAEQGLRLWADRSGSRLDVIDDRSEPAVLTEHLPKLAASADVLFGPYSTVLTRAAIPVAEAHRKLLFNHGGSGGRLDIPGRVVNILTPANRYALPFFRFLCAEGSGTLHTTTGPGAFGRDVIAGALYAGIIAEPLDLHRPPTRHDGVWDLLSAGVYEDDVIAVRQARALPNPPRYVCSVAAGVASFADDVGDPEGVFGIGQWARGADGEPDLGMDETQFLNAWRQMFDTWPDYPGVQAYAAGIIAEAAVRTARSTDAAALWATLAGLDFTTIFGRFRIDPKTGVQVGHDSVLTRWSRGEQLVVESATDV